MRTAWPCVDIAGWSPGCATTMTTKVKVAVAAVVAFVVVDVLAISTGRGDAMGPVVMLLVMVRLNLAPTTIATKTSRMPVRWPSSTCYWAGRALAGSSRWRCRWVAPPGHQPRRLPCRPCRRPRCVRTARRPCWPTPRSASTADTASPHRGVRKRSLGLDPIKAAPVKPRRINGAVLRRPLEGHLTRTQMARIDGPSDDAPLVPVGTFWAHLGTNQGNLSE